MNVVIVGHVDHGKSTFTGRLLADSGALPDGKLEAVREWCATHSRPFEYAFLLDALKEEQAQGVTIDSARCFFKSEKRHYVIIDAPGHIEFLKNMISGAARAEAAILLISAQEGIKENSRRHGYMLSLLGIKQVAVLINKMDLVDYSQSVFESIKTEYGHFLSTIGVKPSAWVPISARQGDHLIGPSSTMPWYTGLTVLSVMDAFHKEKPLAHLPVRFPVQDVYKFTQNQDDRRIIAGTMVSGVLKAGEDIVVYPSKKRSTIHRIEAFNVTPLPPMVGPDEATGITITTQLFIKPGDVIGKPGDPEPVVGSCFRANVFWLGKHPLVMGKRYKLKTGTAKVPMVVTAIHSVLNSSALTSSTPSEVQRHEVGEIVIETAKPIAIDLVADHPTTSRFVIVDEYDIAGGGLFIANEDHPTIPAFELEVDTHSSVDLGKRQARWGHRAGLVLLTGRQASSHAQELESELFDKGLSTMCLDASSPFSLPAVTSVAHGLLSAGLVVVMGTKPEYVAAITHVLQPFDCFVSEESTATAIAHWVT